jgi:DNA modification methylase
MSKEKAVSFTGQGGLNAIMKSRKTNAVPSGSPMPLDRAKDKKKHVNGTLGKSFTTIHAYDECGEVSQSGTSIFDPVLCEISYRWFSPVGGVVLDPFAGGSVRGIVASKLNRQYIGHELRAEQVQANQIQGEKLCSDETYPPAWICGDSRNIDKTCHDVQADFLFSCPPYADLEVYSDDPQDLSTLAYSEFIKAYREIISKSCVLLKQDSFACFVVGEVRDKKGNYYNFVGDTVTAFIDAGLSYYNEMILVTACGSLPIRAGKQFSSGRKIGKTHQNILVFVKGDGKKAADKCGVVDVEESLLDGVESV